MKRRQNHRLVPISAAALLAGTSLAFAQDSHRFVANFHENFNVGDNTLRLVVLGEVGTVGSISNLEGYHLDFIIDESGVFETPIAREGVEMTRDLGVNGRSLSVTADKPISGIALNRRPGSSDQSALLDIESLGREYYVLGYSPLTYMPSQISITAVEDGTEVTITAPVQLGGVPAGAPITVTLNAGQSVSYAAYNGGDIDAEQSVFPTVYDGGDISGAHVVANSPIAVFSSSQCSNIPVGVTTCDHIMEQNLSVDDFGVDFHLVKNFGGGEDADLIRVVAAEDDTEIFLDGASQGVLAAGEFLEIDKVGDARLTATKPVQLGQYVRGQRGSRILGDPDFAIVPSVDQWLDSYIYATPVEGPVFTQNFLNVAISQADAASLALNGDAVNSAGFVLLDGFLYGNIAIDPGFGVISAANPFLAMVAGFSEADSYFSAIRASSSSLAPEPIVWRRDITQADDVDAELGSKLNPIFAGGTLNASVDQSRDFQIRNSGGTIKVAEGVSVVYSGVLSDFAGASGGLAKSGAGVLTFSGVNTYTGGTLVAEGTLRLTDGAALAGGVVNAATFGVRGTASAAGNFLNQGAIDLTGGGAADQLRIGGDYGGAGGALKLDVALAGSGGTADKLVVAGDVGAGFTLVEASLSGEGGLTGRGDGQGIALVEVGGATDAADFRLAGEPLRNNIFLYDLNLGSDGAWRLQSSYLPTLPTYEAYPSALIAATQPPRLRDRFADRAVAKPGGGAAAATSGLETPHSAPLTPQLWVRGEGSWIRNGGESSAFEAAYDQTISRVQAGADFPLGRFAGGDLVGGVNLQYVNSGVDVESPYGGGSIDIDSYGVGGALTWHGDDGLYADAQASYLRHRADIGPWVSGNEGSSGALSLEVGKRLELTPTWSVAPQAQVSWVKANFDEFAGPYGETVSLRDGDGLRLRLGAALDRRWGEADRANALFFSADAIFAGDRAAGIDVRTGSNVYAFERESASVSGELGVGGRIALSPSADLGGAVYVERGFGGDGRTNVRGAATLNLSW